MMGDEQTKGGVIMGGDYLEQKRSGYLYGGWLTKFTHVEHLGGDECEGLLDGTVYVTEKIDGANVTVARDPDAGLIIASRNRTVSVGGNPPTGFRGLVEYVLAHPTISELLERYPWVLRAEWMVRHTLNYNKESLNHLYVFDVQQHDPMTGRVEDYILLDHYAPILDELGIKRVPDLGVFENPTMELLKELAQGPSALGGCDREGIVCRRYDFVNKYGRKTWGKLVAAEFKEKSHISPEARFAADAISEYDVLKIIENIRDEKGVVTIRDMERIIGTAWHDAVTEGMWSFVKQHKGLNEFNFREARRLVETKAREIALAYFSRTIIGTEEKK